MNQKQIEKWEKIRAKGQSEFVVKQGGLMFGLLLFGLLFPILRFIVEFISNDFTFSFFDKGFQMVIFLHLFFAFPLGCLIYLALWHWNEFNYSRSNHTK